MLMWDDLTQVCSTVFLLSPLEKTFRNRKVLFQVFDERQVDRNQRVGGEKSRPDSNLSHQHRSHRSDLAQVAGWVDRTQDTFDLEERLSRLHLQPKLNVILVCQKYNLIFLA